MKKKAFIILICITALLAGCQNTKTDIANDISTDAGSTSTRDEDIASIGISGADNTSSSDDAVKNVSVVPDSYEDAYSEVLDRCFYGLTNCNLHNAFYSNWYNDCRATVYVKPEDDNGCSLDYAGYEFIDLNSDGIKELIIGNLSDDSKLDKMIYAVYSLQHNVPRDLLSAHEYSSGQDNNYIYLCKGNELITVQSCQNDRRYKCISKLSLSENGLNTEFIESYTSDITYKKIDANENETSISQTEWEKYVLECEAQKVSPDLVPFSQYAPKNPKEYYDDGDGDGSFENQWIFGKGFSSWQEGYKAYIETAPDFPRYRLIYVDDDDIPELAIEGYCEAEGCLIVSFHHGEVNILHTLRLGFSYIEKKGLLCNSNGCQGQYYDIVYSLSEGKWKCIFSGGRYTYDLGSWDDEAGKFLDFHYAIDDVEVDEKTYYEKLKKIYDEKAAIYSFCDGCNKEEFITALSEY